MVKYKASLIIWVVAAVYCTAQDEGEDTSQGQNEEQDSTFCAEVRSFTPNFCTHYAAAQKYCKKLCDEAAEADASVTCTDLHADCSLWAANGHCERSSRVMADCKRSCHPACNGGLHCGRRSPDGVPDPPQSGERRNSIRTARRRNYHPRFKRIVNGSDTTKGEWPWQVSLRVKLPNKMWCGGAILSPNFILTAAHCFHWNKTSERAEDWYITAGDYNYLTHELREQNVTVRKLIRHPRYRLRVYNKTFSDGLWGVADNDVAIMQLTDPIQLGHDNKGSLCLPDTSNPFPDQTECHVIGWGHTKYNGTKAPILQEAKVLTIPLSICNLPINYDHKLTDVSLCAGYEEGGIDACNGDSGGPLVCERSGRWYSTGIVSSGYECARPNAYGLYANVPKFTEWIVDNIFSQADV